MVNLKDGLVLHLSFDEGAPDNSTVAKVFDKSKFQNHGTVSGAVLVKPYEDMSDDSMDVGKNPLEIFDDGGVAFWTLVAGSEADETIIKKHGTDSYKVTLTNQTLDAYHDYGANQDWSRYDYIVIYIYGCNTSDTIRVEAWNEVYAGKTNGYYYAITDDFTGWKRFFLPLERFSDIAVPTGWENIMCVRLLGGANQSCVYYFDWLIADVGNWKFGESGNFDGTNDKIVVPTSPSLEFYEGVTVSVWINPNEVDDWSQASVVNHFDLTNYKWKIGLTNGGQARFDVYNQTSGASCYGGSIQIGEWYHLVGTWDGTTIKLYINGSFITYYDFSGNIRNVQPDLVIGYEQANARYFDGLIDEVRVYNRVLSPEEIRALYLKRVK